MVSGLGSLRPQGGRVLTCRTAAGERQCRAGADGYGSALASYTHGMDNNTCTHCGTVGLAEGFIEDAGEHSRGYARWIEGAMERGFFGGAKRTGRPRRQIVAYRCPECGHLELFATGEV